MKNAAQQRIDEAFGRVSQTVWIVTASDGARRGGLVATWAGRASIDPTRPVATAAIAGNHFTRELIDGRQAFALHLITADQVDLAWRFGIGSGRDVDKLAGLGHRKGESGSPILDEALCWFDCRMFARYAAGDRIYYWADILDAGATGDGEPLTDQQLFSLASAEQLAALKANRDADIAEQAGRYEVWRKQLDGPGE